MPSNSPINEPNPLKNTGTLYVVATPIGNQDDITVRALSVFREVDLIAAEDTRKTRRFLALHDVRSKLVSYHEHNEEKRTPQLIQKLLCGHQIALASNAGTPSVSDPGYRLIQAAISHNIEVVPVPGVSAAIAALSVAGLPTEAFVFTGFLSKKKGRRLKQLQDLATEDRTFIIYESPKRILALLQDIITILGDRRAVLAREMTKIHEEFIRGRVSEIAATLKNRSGIKGECTLLVAGNVEIESISRERLIREISEALESGSLKASEIARQLSKKYQLPRNSVYDEVLKMKRKKA
ncbi:MAG: 16S rRNA (cytidine(1402)-2'-O)-methyltransferase [Deltaproteobacteria bacterium]|jgi:16S rRNA (cytidine1402-2'-O)-methyltransferase|nr:16S rRNA (cytidine(1402)-2'-O)-methyltransferase [Deltaproteobacteria bacterium]